MVLSIKQYQPYIDQLGKMMMISNLPQDEKQDKEMALLPYHAINEFMRDDFRLSVIRMVLQSLSKLSQNSRRSVEDQIKRVVNVPGFRNSIKAPIGLQIKPVTNAFIKDPEVVIAIISAWCELHSGLSDQISSILKERKWDVVPIATDRNNLPGFLPKWPEGEDFNSINHAYTELFPGRDIEPDDIGLMAVWLSGRLPYENKLDTPNTEIEKG